MSMQVSVVIPVYKAAAFVEDAVRSVLALREVHEVVLVEDGSPDNSLELCRRIEASDTRVRLVQHDGGVNKGAAASRNLGMREASSPFVAFLDADDRFLPERFVGDAQVFHAHPDADGVYNAIGVHYHDAEGQRRFDQQFGSELTTVRRPMPPKELFPALIGVSGLLDVGHFSLDGLTMRKAALDRMPQLMREDLVIGEDTEFTIRLSFHCNLYPGSLDKAVSLRGVHADNRVTSDPRRNITRLRLYRALSEWSGTTNMGMEARTKLAKDAATYEVLCARTGAERAKAIALLFRHPGLLKRVDVSEAAVALLSGQGTWLTRMGCSMVRWMHRLLWRIKGAAPPTPSNRDK
ncbi:MAG: glycosyltransferase family 2 protein [Flavobacteriales bacterium]|nr:glycosyltransferase family 2 protein [Flavobacteriales bacterium]